MAEVGLAALTADQRRAVDWALAGRSLFFTGSAGTGKSTISAALVREFLGRPVAGTPGAWVGPISAVHFLKHSDQRRLDPVAIVRSLVFQLTSRLPKLQTALFGLPEAAQKLTSLRSVDEACALLLPLVEEACAGEETVVLLLDALDEADPPEQQRADYDRSSGCVAPDRKSVV